MLSELRNPKGDARVRRAVDSLNSDDLFLSVVTVGEVTKGISLLDEGQKKRSLTTWLMNLERHYGQRILPVDLEVCRIWGELTAAARQKGHTVAVADGLIAATAWRHGLHVMTRNTTDFAPTNVLVINPWVSRRA